MERDYDAGARFSFDALALVLAAQISGGAVKREPKSEIRESDMRAYDLDRGKIYRGAPVRYHVKQPNNSSRR